MIPSNFLVGLMNSDHPGYEWQPRVLDFRARQRGEVSWIMQNQGDHLGHELIHCV
jgi:hypothetical protein